MDDLQNKESQMEEKRVKEQKTVSDRTRDTKSEN